MAEYLSDEERVEWLRNWWSRHGMALIAGIVVAVGGVIGWRWYQDYRQDQAEDASLEYTEYMTARALGQSDTSGLAADLGEAHEGSTYHVFALLHEAADAVGGEDWERAAALLAASVDYARDDVVRDLAAMRLARVQRQLGQFEQALGVLGGVLSPGFGVEVAELTGDILLEKGDSAGARDAYQSALDLGPTTDAGQFMLELKLASLVPGDAGDAGDAGDGVAGEVEAGEAEAGDAVSGDAVSGDAVSGDADLGDAASGDAEPADAGPSDEGPGDVGPGDAVPANAVTDGAEPGDAAPDDETESST